MDLGLADKVALVVGGSRGIGLAAATMFAGEGACVAIAAREQKVLGAAATQIAKEGESLWHSHATALIPRAWRG
jgi:3-oxoacyl-[acyl-carrier protein] reductase